MSDIDHKLKKNAKEMRRLERLDRIAVSVMASLTGIIGAFLVFAWMLGGIL